MEDGDQSLLYRFVGDVRRTGSRWLDPNKAAPTVYSPKQHNQVEVYIGNLPALVHLLLPFIWALPRVCCLLGY